MGKLYAKMCIMSKVKICFVVTKGVWGGAQRYVYDLVTNLPKNQFEVVVACGAGETLPEKLKTAGIRVLGLPLLTRNIGFISEIKSSWNLLKIIRREKPDVLHLNSPKAAGFGAVAGRLCGVKKIIYTVHGFAFNEDRNVLSKAIIWFFSWITILLSRKTIVICEKEKWQATGMPFVKNKIVLIYNGITRMTLANGDKIRSMFPIGAKITGTIGELTNNKNQISLIEEAKQEPDMYVAIIGEGELRTMLESKIIEHNLEKRVKLFGFVPAEEVLKGFDVFSLPSKKEGLPYVLLEAKQAGLPIIANRVGGVSDILDATDPNEFTLEKMLEKTMESYYN